MLYTFTLSYKHFHFLVFLYRFGDRASLYNPGWPEIFDIDQAGLGLAEFCLPLFASIYI